MTETAKKTKREKIDAYWKKKRETVRHDEVVGGGSFVFRRDKSDGRLVFPSVPFEHPTLDSAIIEAQRLAKEFPGETFCVVGQVATTDDPYLDQLK